jgi:hypothetical protein
MTISADIENIQAKGDAVGVAEQLERMRERLEQQGASGRCDTPQLGVDRSRELTPIPRPSMVRSHVSHDSGLDW